VASHDPSRVVSDAHVLDLGPLVLSLHNTDLLLALVELDLWLDLHGKAVGHARTRLVSCFEHHQQASGLDLGLAPSHGLVLDLSLAGPSLDPSHGLDYTYAHCHFSCSSLLPSVTDSCRRLDPLSLDRARVRARVRVRVLDRTYDPALTLIGTSTSQAHTVY